jgi:hypothetical protein
MKCPHCGIEVRDTTVICGYCGGKIPQKKGTPASPQGVRVDMAGTMPQKAPPAKKSKDEEPESDEGEEGGGLSSLLQQGEQVLIGSLNVSVKKFLFHAYLTNQRIFLIDTHEKKLKVTAKDIPLESIAESIVEVSENSDPVLVLSIRSADDELKTMKLVFAQDGMDRSSEIDEWIDLLNEQTRPKKHKKPPAQKEATEPEPDEEQPAPSYPQKTPAVRQDFQPARKPAKDHEKQPPVKRLLSLYPESHQEEPEEPKPRGTDSRPTGEPSRRPVVQQKSYREIPPTRETDARVVKKVEVQSVMKTAMKGAMQPARQPQPQPVKRTVSEPIRTVLSEPDVPEVHEREKESLEKEQEAHEEGAAAPFFCHNCGKKLPSAANFCPGCGTKLGQQHPARIHAPAHDKKSRKSEEVPPESEKDEHRPAKPPAKRAPKGSEMTILHKFLRR